MGADSTKGSPVVSRMLGPRLAASLSAITLALGLSACTADQPHQGGGPPTVPEVRVPPRKAGQTFVFDPFEQQLVSYDDARGHVVATSHEDGFYYYGFRTATNLYTSGDNETNGFKILEIDAHTIRTVVTMPKDEAVFPLATAEGKTFFIVYDYKPGFGEEELRRRIVRLLPDGTMQTYRTFTGRDELVDDGVLLGGRLYYTLGDASSDVGSLYSIDAREPGAEPRLERTGLKSDEVYAQGGRLLTSDGTTITDGKRSFTCTDLCWFYDDPSVLVAFVDEGTSTILKVIDATTGRTLHEVGEPVGFQLDGRRLTVRTTDGVKRIRLSKAGSA